MKGEDLRLTKDRHVFSIRPQRQTLDIIPVPYRTSVNHLCQLQHTATTQLNTAQYPIYSHILLGRKIRAEGKRLAPKPEE